MRFGVGNVLLGIDWMLQLEHERACRSAVGSCYELSIHSHERPASPQPRAGDCSRHVPGSWPAQGQDPTIVDRHHVRSRRIQA